MLTYLFSASCILTFSQFSEKGETKYYYLEDNPNQLFAIDTGLKNFEEYNFDHQDDWEYFNLGIIGSAQQKLSFNWNNKKGFKDGSVFFNNYKLSLEKLRRFKTTKLPYSEFSYLVGSRFEQIIKLTHSQNVKNRFRFAIDLYGMSSAGSFAENQRTRNVGLSFYSIYASKNNRYHLATDFSYSTLKTKEIGGIIEDVLIEQFIPKTFHTEQLEDALTKQKTLELALKNSYGFGFFKIDSINDTTIVKKFFPVFMIKHKIATDITRNSFLSKSKNDSLYLNDFYQYNDSTFNKLAYHNITNRFSIEYLGTKNTDSITYRNIRAEFALQHNNLEIWNNNFEKTSNNLMIDLDISSNNMSKSNFKYRFNTYYVFTGINKNDLHVKASVGYDLQKIGIMNASFMYENIRPTWVETFYHSNSVNWNNEDFENKQIFQANFIYQLKKYKLKIETNFSLLEQYIYFDKNSSPIQSNAKITYWNASIKKDTKWKIWHWNNFIGFQTTNHQEILPLPKLFLKTSLYAEFRMFKSNLLLNTGLDLRYNTAFKAKSWNPVIAQFYNQDERTMNYTPVVDVFVNARIKTVRIYLKLNYANEGLFVNNYYKALNYPSNGRTFSFGGSWRFFE